MYVKQINIIKNIMALYGLTIAKIIFPLITLPYLTRVVSIENYGVISYVKSIMQYLQIVVDFGFLLSGTKDIVKFKNDKSKLAIVNSMILSAQIILSIMVFGVLLIMCLLIPILKNNILYTLLSYVNVFLSVFLFEYLFRGLEKMEIVTGRFILMKGISTMLTFVFVKTNEDIFFIPILDIVGSALAIIWVFFEIKKLDIKISLSSITDALIKLKESMIYFVSNMATTAFGALNTFLIGICLSSADIAYWSVCMQLIGGIQTLYTPIINGIYPEMIKNPNLNLIKNFLKIFMPIILIGSYICVSLSEIVLEIVGGIQYREAAYLFCILTPILIFSFPGMLLGWPTLGAIEKTKQVTFSTVATASFQIFGLLILLITDQFSLFNIAIVRILTELLLLVIRASFVYKFRKDYKF